MTVEIPLTKGFITVVDDQDTDLAVCKWWTGVVGRKSTHFYARRDVGGRSAKRCVYLHRLIAERIIGRPLEKHEVVDHIDGNPLNNQRSNLRVVSQAQNMWNARRLQKTDTPRGVSWDKSRQQWRAQIRINRINKFLGRFDTQEEASCAYREAAINSRGNYARFD